MTDGNDARPWIAWLAVCIGLAMVLLGLSLNVLYAIEAMRSLSDADRSVLFWALPVVLIGCASILMGAALSWLGRRAARGDRQVLSVVRALLITMAVVAVLVLSAVLLRLLF